MTNSETGTIMRGRSKALYWRAYSGRHKPLLKRSCNDVPELIAFKYSPTQFGKYQDPKNKSSILRLRVSYHAEGIDSDTYKHMKVEEKLKKAGKTLDDIPITNGFYKFEFSGKQYLFIATNNNTKLGNPLTFYCSPDNYDRSNLVCGTAFPWREGMSIGVTSTTKMFAVEDWPKLYEEIQKFTENLIIEQGPVSYERVKPVENKYE